MTAHQRIIDPGRARPVRFAVDIHGSATLLQVECGCAPPRVATKATTPLDAPNCTECDCTARSDFPCWPCYRDGRKQLPE